MIGQRSRGGRPRPQPERSGNACCPLCGAVCEGALDVVAHLRVCPRLPAEALVVLVPLVVPLPPPAARPVTAIGGVEFDRDRQRLSAGGREIFLPRLEAKLLDYLARNAGRVLSRAEIVTRAWHDEDANQRSVDVHVYRLRSRLGQLGVPAGVINTVRGVGYALELPYPDE